LDEQNEQTSEEDHAAVRGSKPGTDELQQKVEILVQRLAESSRREQDLNDRAYELVDSKDVLEEKNQQMEKLLPRDEAGWLHSVCRSYSF